MQLLKARKFEKTFDLLLHLIVVQKDKIIKLFILP
jgi:hypothetical protein